jgi:hypothetical protein
MLYTGTRTSTKFKDELRKYPWPRSTAIRAHLQRWLDNDETEAVWRKISRAADQLKADDFIGFVVKARCRAAGLVPTLDFHTEAGRRYLAAHEARIKAAFKAAFRSKNRSLSEIADVLEDAAADFRLCENLLEDRLSGLPINVVSRKDQKGSQARRAFCLAVGEFLNEKSGKWMDDEVATLLDIALPRKKQSTIVEVSEFRKKRHPKTTQH